MTKQEFEETYKDVIPEGVFRQVKIQENLKNEFGKTVYDTSHDISIHNKETNTVTKFASAKHAHFAGFIEDVLNGLRNGDLVFKEDCQ